MIAPPDQVPRDPTAVMGRRTAAFVVDSLVIIVPTALVASAEFEYLEGNERGEIELTGGAIDPDEFCDRYLDQETGGSCFAVADRVYFTEGDPSPAASLTALGLAILLLVVLQGLRGVTPGKALFGIRTVREDGRPPGIGRAIVRWLLWIVDGAPWCLPLVGFITALISTGHRRVGDMAAKTLVVRRQDAGHPVVVPGLFPAAGARPDEPTGVAPAGFPPPPAGSTAHPPPGDSTGYPPPNESTAHPPSAGTTGYPPPGESTAHPPPAGTTAHLPTGEGTDHPPDEAADHAPPGGGTDHRPAQAPAGQPARASGAERPLAEHGRAGDWYRPQWDPARGTYIVWDPRRGQWLGWDVDRQEWEPL